MSNLISKLFWRSAVVGVLVLSAFVYYLKFPDFRESVDAKFPKVKELTAGIVSRWDKSHAPEQAPAPAAVPAVAEQTAPAASPIAAATPATPVQTSAAPAEIVAPKLSDTVDLAQLSQSRSEWPKSVSLKKTVEFPAVLEGKVIGNVNAPVGAEAHLILIKDNKLGLEYQGGGAMVAATDTDLVERILVNRHASNK